MNKPAAPINPLPANLLDTLRAASSEDKIAALASLDRQSRQELTTLARKFLSLVERSYSWKPDLLTHKLMVRVESGQDAVYALTQLHKLGCVKYEHDPNTTPITHIFVSLQGDYSFIFEGDKQDKLVEEALKEGRYVEVTLHQVMRSKSISDLEAAAEGNRGGLKSAAATTGKEAK